MAKIRIVPEEDMKVISEYIEDDPAVVLITENAAKEIKKKYPELNIEDGMNTDYDFGGDADYFVEVVAHAGHYFVDDLRDSQNDSL